MAQVSPGPLSRSHAELDGAAQCLDCHGGGGESLEEHCLACHREIAWQVGERSGFHGLNRQQDCAGCHPEHAGREFELIDWGPRGEESFDHRLTGWRLEGRHATLRCRECHRDEFQSSSLVAMMRRKDTSRSWLGLETDCVACHDDYHRGTLDNDCAACHGAQAWKPAGRFDHASAAFPLTGRHDAVACEKCHLIPGRVEMRLAEDRIAPRYRPVAHGECSDCHGDAHAARLGSTCAACHVTDGFEKVNRQEFDHARTRYALRGRHAAVACDLCHDPIRAGGRRPPFERCGTCHEDAHAGQATLAGQAQDCAACHDERGFERSTYTMEMHRSAPYPVKGKHLLVGCRECHVKSPARERLSVLGPSGIELRPAHETCRDCHSDAHGTQLAHRDDGGACECCHSVEGWRQITYTAESHASSKLPLEERHAEIACVSCHTRASGDVSSTSFGSDRGRVPVMLAGLDADCASCHEDSHRGRFAADGVRPVPGGCAACHDSRLFHRTSVGADQHRAFAYRLEGAHRAVPCVDCHADLKAPPSQVTLRANAAQVRSLLFVVPHDRCERCHLPFHGGQFASRPDGGDCGGCHAVDTFGQATRFDHDRDAAFSLGGAHRDLSCERCHLSRPGSDGLPRAIYRPLPHRCEDCHGVDAVFDVTLSATDRNPKSSQNRRR